MRPIREVAGLFFLASSQPGCRGFKRRKRLRNRFAGFLAGALLYACPANASDLSSPADYAVPDFANAAVRWNWEARDLVRRSRSDPLWAARSYAISSIAQYEAARKASAAPAENREAFVDLAIGTASALTLAHLFPHDAPRVTAMHVAHVKILESSLSADEATRAQAIGTAAAGTILKAREADGSISLEAAPPPLNAKAWFSSEDWPPQRTYWGKVRPFLAESIARFDPPPPPLNDVAFQRALDEVRQARADNPARNDELAKKWADGPGTPTPPGRWNKIAAALIAERSLDELSSTRILAYLNMALVDASIACWHAKFRYWLLRPSQADGRIVPTYPLPNFPAYPSGHATFSATAATFLSDVFPDQKGRLTAMAEEAARSRVVGGIHYPFDASAGLDQGREVARLAVARFRSDRQEPADQGGHHD